MIRRQQSGFTLVELAIGLLVIGLMVGGILQGAEMLQNAAYKKTMKDLSSYQMAYRIFQENYRGLPGDIDNAQTVLSRCVAPLCLNGDNNRIVGRPGSTAQSDQTGTSQPRVETSMFWQHLLLADLINGVQEGADPSAPAAGATHPYSALGRGAYSVYHRQGIHGISIKACPNSQTCGAAVLTPRQVWILDQKMDGDGSPFTGTIKANHGGCPYVQGASYNLSSEQPCYVLFDLD